MAAQLDENSPVTRSKRRKLESPVGNVIGSSDSISKSRKKSPKETKCSPVAVIAGDKSKSSTDITESINRGIAHLKRQLVGGFSNRNSEEVDLLFLPDNSQHQTNLEALLTQAVENGLSRSALLLGQRGCGKTLVVESTIRKLLRKFPGSITVVRLNGLLHSDEKTALREISSQLRSQHSLPPTNTSSFDDNLQFLREMMKQCARISTTLIFILDEFHNFATANRKTLLYTLLDSLHSEDANAAIIGISCHLDAEDKLEKRVKSRFSRRIFVFRQPSPKSLFSLLEHSLQLPEGSDIDQEYVMLFNKSVKDLLASSEFQKVFEWVTSLGATPQAVLQFGYRALCCMDRSGGLLTLTHFEAASRQQLQEGKWNLLMDISILELYLLVAMKKLEDKSVSEYNFNSVFQEYDQLRIGSRSMADSFSKATAMRAFERLLGKGLVSHGTSGGFGPSVEGLEFRAVQMLIHSSQLERAIHCRKNCPQPLKEWFSLGSNLLVKPIGEK